MRNIMEITYKNNQGELKSFRLGWNKGRSRSKRYCLKIDDDIIGYWHSAEEVKMILAGFVLYADTKVEIIERKEITGGTK